MHDNSTPRHLQSGKVKNFLFGAPYYPEHDTQQDRLNDPQLLANAGVNAVRIGEFAWDQMEPSRGRYDFSLFDETIDRLGKAGVHTILCTPTATPPVWLTAGHDDWLRVDANDRRMPHGSRQHCCTNNEQFRAESRRITAAMAEHYKDNPYVTGWQTDNEFYCHITFCYCQSCVSGFQQWLKQKYGQIGELNKAWGTAFWAQTYDKFENIPLPYFYDRPATGNPSHQLDYLRYVSDSLVEFQRQQVDILKKANPAWFVTHNGMFEHVDYWKFTDDLDFLSVDNYPGFNVQPQDAKVHTLRCRASSGSFIVMEQETGAGGNSNFLNHNPQPGQMRLWAFQNVANGADGVLHFRWRSCRFGAEEYWNGVLDHDNVPRRRYQEFAREGADFKKIAPHVLGSTLQVDAGVLIETDQADAFFSASMRLAGPAQQGNEVIWQMARQHLACGFIQNNDKLVGPRLLILPSMPMMDETLTAKLEKFVADGGVLVVTARSATRDRNNQVISTTPPGLLAKLCGTKVIEFGALKNHHNTLAYSLRLNGQDIAAAVGYEILEPTTAQVLAKWNDDPRGYPFAAAGLPAITVNQFGKGKAIYIGTYFDKANVAAMMQFVATQAGLTPLAQADENVEVTCRVKDGRKYLFVLNYNGKPASVSDLPAGVDLLSGQACSGQITLPAYEVAVIACN